jgi:uncharacterized membrane protein
MNDGGPCDRGSFQIAMFQAAIFDLTLDGAPTMSTMTTTPHLWVLAYDDMQRAFQVRDRIAELGWGPGHAAKYIVLLDIAVVVRHLDGTFTVDRRSFPGVANILTCSAVGLLAGLVVAAPLVGAALGAMIGVAGTISSIGGGIGTPFIREIEKVMQPGTSALFILDEDCDIDMILHTLQGLGGTVLKTNVDPERAQLIQSTLAALRKGDGGDSLSLDTQSSPSDVRHSP